ncbi:MAG: FecR domain-containing protein [Proteobacteria bacterium]|nr:FecR domain-containing protein [Pseudomonadota bacterium]
MIRKTVCVVSIVLLFLETIYGTTKYGDVQIERGRLNVVRDGESLTFENSKKPFEILKNDLLRIGNDSLVVLTTADGASAEMGSNSIFMVQAWEQDGRRGYLRMVFGQARFKSIKKTTSRDRFYFKTPMVTIEMRGTIWAQVSITGNTVVIAEDGGLKIRGLSGPEQAVMSSEISMVVNSGPAIPPVNVSKEIQQTVADGNLDAPLLNSNESSLVVKEEILIDDGLIHQKDLDQSKSNRVSIEESFDIKQEEPISEKTVKGKELRSSISEKEFEVDIRKHDTLKIEITKAKTSDLGFLYVADEFVDAFTDFHEPKLPEHVIEMDGLLAGALKAGSISIANEK